MLMFGLARANQIIKNDSLSNFIILWINHHLDAGIKFNHTDKIMPCGVLAQIILAGEVSADNPKYKTLLSAAYDYLTTEKIQLQVARIKKETKRMLNSNGGDVPGWMIFL